MMTMKVKQMINLKRSFAAMLIVIVVILFIAFTLYIIPNSQMNAINRDILAYESKRQEMIAEKARLESVVVALNETLSKQIALAHQNSTANAQVVEPVNLPQIPTTPAPVVTRAS
jgi:hypothetical protein